MKREGKYIIQNHIRGGFIGPFKEAHKAVAWAVVQLGEQEKCWHLYTLGEPYGEAVKTDL